ncbi:type IV pilus assembly protein PilY1 [Marinobacter nauticus]|uniref:Type IV pilus assembly protein PilY1 n=1 Tax=Marinobacter nauticus TaxID=2743 RepID=A0A368XEU3_MARNT|nr:PilC/PilY family type IV pilus protein [Marinobacter nauticus]RCW66470.1 type IV pilus assembly protein PilY1 [Marinobacter nauticus]
MKSMNMKQKYRGAGVFRFVAALTVPVLGSVLSVQAAVEVDQSPLIVSDPLPPNIVLLHDDSGSMRYNYLPDTAPRSGDDFRDSSQNRQYYNPETLYTLPPKADGTLYPEPTFPNGYGDPFEDTAGTVDILSDSDYSDSGRYVDYSYNRRKSCERDGGDWNSYYDVCVFEGTPSFVYFVGNEEHHVIEDGESCDGFTNCHHAGDSLTIDGEETTYGQNVANYYSYYRSRFLSAKSGIMGAFSELDPAFRFGFGSINNSNSDDLVDKFTHDWTATNKWGNEYVQQSVSIEKVKEFGDGSENTQKERFWEWLEGVGASGRTPLRRALEAAGEYYQTKQPWLDTDDQGREVEYACRPAYTILVSDGYWSGSAPSEFLKDSDNDKTNNYSVIDPFKGGSADDGSATLADVANYYWKTDLRPDAENQVPATPTDPATWQHMTTFTVGLGLSVNDLSATQTQLFDWARTGEKPEGVTWNGWPEPGDGNGSGESENVSDMLHAAINGHGDFFSARDPKQFSEGIKKALADIAEAPGAGSTPSFSGGETLTSSTRQYTASYTTGSWIGELYSVGYDEATDSFSVDPWRASAQLPAAADRNIWTTNKSGSAVEFKPDSLSEYLATLGDNLYLADPKGADWGDDIVNYLRGDRKYEDQDETPLDSVLRKRDSLLGDIVTSTPVVIGAPKPDLYKNVLDETYFEGLSGKTTYDSFVTDNASRTPLVYVAANDGMLHAFNANTGAEVFAFIPGAVVGGTGDASLARLANPEYGVYNPVDGTQPVPHQYFNDGKLTTQNVYLDGEWKTILVGTTGRGTSRTVYALDITNPADLADPKKAADAILWERSAGDGKSNADWIGMSLGRPTISLIKSSTEDEGQWVVHVGNGPNSENNKAALLQFDLATGALSVYAAGSMTDNGLAAPYVIQNNNTDGISEYAFAGDLQGNVWSFPLSPTGGNVSAPIYVAKDASGDRQPITADMYATQNPNTGAVWVFFGTGRFLTDGDIRQSDPQVQTWYGLRALKGGSSSPAVTYSNTRSNLQKREILAENVEGTEIYRATSIGDFSDLTEDDNVGWYMDLVSPNNGKEGERAVYQTQLIGGRLIVNTLIPKSSSPCDTFPGGATLIVDPFSGANPGEGVLDTNDDGETDDKDSTTISGEIHHYNGQRYEVGMAGSVSALIQEGGKVRLFGLGLDSREMTLDTTMGATGAQRLNWHEILN